MLWEFKFMKFLKKKLHNKYLKIFFKICSYLANFGLIFLIMMLVLYFTNPYRKEFVEYLFMCQLLSAIIVNLIMKPLFSRKRPFLVDESIIPLIKRPKDMSFPSGHSCAGFSFATGVYYFNEKWGIIAYIYAGLLAFSRLYLQVHYPTDIIIGGFIGSGVSILIKIFYAF